VGGVSAVLAALVCAPAGSAVETINPASASAHTLFCHPCMMLPSVVMCGSTSGTS
jgi:hypothetical protein